MLTSVGHLIYHPFTWLPIHFTPAKQATYSSPRDREQQDKYGCNVKLTFTLGYQTGQSYDKICGCSKADDFDAASVSL